MTRLTQFLLSAHFTLVLMLASFLGVGLIVFLTSPIGLGPAGMLMAFAVFYVWFLALALGAMHVFRAVRKRRDVPGETDHARLTGRMVLLAAAWAFAPLILLALQSIGQLTFVGAGLVLLFEALATMYIARR